MAAITSASDSFVDTKVTITAGSQIFAYFPKFPLELRNIVWEYASNQPRNLDIWAPTIGSITSRWSLQSPTEEFKIFKYYTTCPVPSVLQASRESRAVALKFYKLSFEITVEFEPHDTFAINIPPRIYCNPGIDRSFTMGKWNFDAKWNFWNENTPTSCAVNILDYSNMRDRPVLALKTLPRPLFLRASLLHLLLLITSITTH